MDYCLGSHRWVIPDTVIIRVKGPLPPRQSRVNGWSKHLHPFQLVAWTMFLIVVLFTFCFFIPMLPCEWQYITYAVSFYDGVSVCCPVKTSEFNQEGHQHGQPSPCQVCAVEPCPHTELSRAAFTWLTVGFHI
uniref:Uncharacterized protein n=1 Tax=Rhinolophus ferrumequinum TaxID=59479 RepID=A0A671DUE3_RHIFE